MRRRVRRAVAGGPRSGRGLVVFGLGANQGDAVGSLRQALRELDDAYGLLAVGPLYRTAPLSAIPQDDYFNTVALAPLPAAAPTAVLAHLQELERRAGRLSGGPRNGPRPLDLDLLVYGELVADLPGPPPLRLPHPRLRERRFVLAPLADLAPGLRLPPDGAPVASLLAALGDEQRIERCTPDPLGADRG